MREHQAKPEDGEDEDDDESGEEPGDAGRVGRIEIRLSSVVESNENDDVNRTRKPAEIGFEEIGGLNATLGREPVSFIGQIDELDGQASDDERDAESDDGHREGDKRQRHEEAGLGLPAVGRALRIEVRGDNVGQFRIKKRKVDRGEKDHEEESELWEARNHAANHVSGRNAADVEREARCCER